MNDQISLAYSVQPDGTNSYALSVIPAEGDMRSINMSSLGADQTDTAFILAINHAIAEYRAAKGF
jgi:hypothetical protein